MRRVFLLACAVGACRAPERTAPAASSTVIPAATPTASSIASAAPSAPPSAREWTFDSDAVGSPPAGFSFGRTGEGREGKWLVRADPANVLAQTDGDPTDNRFPVAFTVETFPADVDLRVKCKPMLGSVDRACGLVLRVSDANNYYLTRANALENNVRLYFVKEGHRQQLASWSGPVTSGAWHDLRIVAKGDHFEVSWDGSTVIDHRDTTFLNGGHVGVWTKADSVSYFDNLSVKPP